MTELKFFPHGVFALGMLIAGSLNSIAYKIADWQTADGVYSAAQCNWTTPPPDPEGPCLFVHPFFQVYAMFLGECLCLITFFVLRCLGKVEPAKPFNPFVFLLPAICDTCGTSLMMIGLLLTFASTYQMLRGSVVVFTGIFSRLFLKRILSGNNWAGLLLVLCGTAVVGLDSVIYPQSSATASNPALGNVLIVAAQVVVAIQMIVEEKFVGDRDIPPLLAVGSEGVFGMIILTIVMAFAYHIPGVEGLSETPDRLDDVWDGMQQVRRPQPPLPRLSVPAPPPHVAAAPPLRVAAAPQLSVASSVPQVFAGGNALLTSAMIAVVLSIAFFNFFGISVTKSLSAAHRMVLDSTRSVVVWIFSLAVAPPNGDPQKFSWMQLLGFIILIAGSLVYYEILALPGLSAKKRPATLTANSSLSEAGPPLDASLLPMSSVQSDAPQNGGR